MKETPGNMTLLEIFNEIRWLNDKTLIALSEKKILDAQEIEKLREFTNALVAYAKNLGIENNNDNNISLLEQKINNLSEHSSLDLMDDIVGKLYNLSLYIFKNKSIGIGFLIEQGIFIDNGQDLSFVSGEVSNPFVQCPTNSIFNYRICQEAVNEVIYIYLEYNDEPTVYKPIKIFCGEDTPLFTAQQINSALEVIAKKAPSGKEVITVDNEQTREELTEYLKQLAQEKLAQEQLAQEKLAQEQLAQEKLAQEQLAREELAREELAREEQPQEELAREEQPQEELAQEEQPKLQTKAKLLRASEALSALTMLAGEAIGLNYLLTKQTGLGLVNYGASALEAITSIVNNPASAPIMRYSSVNIVRLSAVGLASSVLIGYMSLNMHRSFRDLDNKLELGFWGSIGYDLVKYNCYMLMAAATVAPIVGAIMFPLTAGVIVAVSFGIELSVGIGVDIAHHVNIDQGSILSYPKAKFESLCFRGSSREIG